MKLTKWPLAALFVACCSANAADLFFVVGQSNTLWRGQQTQAAAPAEVKLLHWTSGSQFTSMVSQACKQDCPVTAPVDGVVPAFASTWTALSKSPAHFAIYRKPEAALTQAGANNQAYWTDFEAPSGIYQDALSEFRQAQKSVTTTTTSSASSEAISRRYLVWVQNEVDVRAGVSAKDYKAKLIALFDRFNQDLGAQGKPFDAMFLVSSGLVREVAAGTADQKSSKTDTAYLGKLNAIVEAQDSAGAEGKIVMVSRSLRSSLSRCASGLGSPGCETKDLLRYHAWLHETLGSEMARNAFTFHAKGIKPLLPSSCKQEPSSCAGSVDVYRWVAKLDASSKPVYGTEPYEFDEAAYRVSRMRFGLFQDSAPGRIALYRTSDAGGSGISTEPGSTKTKALGYCYAKPTGNANAKLVVMQQDGMTDVARQPTEALGIAALSQEGDTTLCYVN